MGEVADNLDAPMTVAPVAVRKHPDLFTAEEAAAYLHLDDVRRLQYLRENFGLHGQAGFNRSLMYSRENLDKCAERMMGKDLSHQHVNGEGRLRIAGARR